MRVGKVVEYATQAQEAGATMALDGGVGEVIIAPSQDDVDLLTERSEQREKALADSHGVGMTYDGHRVALLANIGTADDAQRAAQKTLKVRGYSVPNSCSWAVKQLRVLKSKPKYTKQYLKRLENVGSQYAP